MFRFFSYVKALKPNFKVRFWIGFTGILLFVFSPLVWNFSCFSASDRRQQLPSQRFEIGSERPKVIVESDSLENTLPPTPNAHSGLQHDGVAIGIVDGDSIFIREGSKEYEVRLAGIDAPEIGQKFGIKSREYLRKLVFGKTVFAYETGELIDGGLAVIMVVETIGNEGFPTYAQVNKKMVESGMAWFVSKLAKGDSLRNDLIQLEQDARGHQAGLWTLSNPLSPAEWQKRNAGRPKDVSQYILGDWYGGVRRRSERMTFYKDNTFERAVLSSWFPFSASFTGTYQIDAGNKIVLSFLKRDGANGMRTMTKTECSVSSCILSCRVDEYGELEFKNQTKRSPLKEIDFCSPVFIEYWERRASIDFQDNLNF